MAIWCLESAFCHRGVCFMLLTNVWSSYLWLFNVLKGHFVTEECLSPRLGQDTAEKCRQELAAVFTPELALAVYIPLCRIFGRSVNKALDCQSVFFDRSVRFCPVCLLWQISEVLSCLSSGRSVKFCTVELSSLIDQGLVLSVRLLWQISEVLSCLSSGMLVKLCIVDLSSLID